MQFGEEGLDRANKLLKQQLSSSNALISSLEKDKKDREDKLENALRSVSNERARADALESRVEAAEGKERTLRDELSQARLDVSNFEARYQAESAKVSELERDVKRLEYSRCSAEEVLTEDLESAAMEGSSHTAQDDQLRTMLKAAEEDARRARMELAQLQATQAAGAGKVSPRGSRRRASSFSGAESVHVASEPDGSSDALREAQSQIDTLERKLAAAVRERDQAVNAKMALQKKADREIEEAKDRAQALQYELDARAFGELPSALETQNAKLRADLKAAHATVLALEEAKEKLQEELQQRTSFNKDESEATIAELQDRLASLKTQKERSRSQTPEGDASGDRSNAHLQRELKAAKRKLEVKEREIESLEQDLLDANEEIETIRGTSDPTSPPSDAAAERVAELTAQVASLTEELASAKSELEAQRTDFEKRMAETAKDLATARRALNEQDGLVAKLKADVQAADSKHHDVAQLENQNTEAQARILELEHSRAVAEGQLHNIQQKLSESSELVSHVECERDSLKTTLTVKEELLQEISAKCARLSTELADRAEDIDALEVARRKLVMHEQRIVDLESQQTTDANSAARLVKAQKEVTMLKDKVEALQSSMAEMEAHLTSEVESLAIQLKDKEVELMEALVQSAKMPDLETTIINLRSELKEKLSLYETSRDKQTELETQVQQMTFTIQRLRSDRDDMRSQLRYAEAETKFTSDAEVGAVAEIAQLKTRVSSLEGDLEAFTAITSERDDLADNIKVIESERDAVRHELAELQTQQATLRQELADRERELSESIEAEQERRRKAETRVEELLLSATVADMPEDEQRKEIKALFERIERREARIKVLTNDVKKLQMNYAVAQDDLKDLTEELEMAQNATAKAAESEAQLQRQLSDSQSLEAQVQKELEDVKASEAQLQRRISDELVKLCARDESIAKLEARLSSVMEDYALSLSTAADQTRDLVLAIAIYQKGIDSATEHGVATERALQASIAKVSKLEAEQAVLLERGSGVNELREQLAALRQEVETSTAELASTADRRAELETRVEELETELEMSKVSRNEIETRTALLEKELIEANNALASAASEHQEAVAELNRQLIQAADSQATRSAEQDAELETALRQAATELEKAEQEAAGRLDNANELLRTARDEIAALSQRIEQISVERSTAETERDAATARAEELAGPASLVDSLQAEIGRLESELFEAMAARSAQVERIDNLVAELSESRADHAALNEDLAAVTADLEGYVARETELLSALDAGAEALKNERTAVEKTQAALAISEKENRSSASRIRFMESQVRELTQRIADLRDDLDAVNSGSSNASRIAADKDDEISRLKKERAALKTQVEALNDDLQRAYASLTSKTNEIEDADDRQQELTKEISRQKKRVAKLERQNKSLLSELETTRNTLDNVSPARPTPMRSAPILQVLDTSAAPTGTPKHKRSRDEEERSVPREVWVQSAPASSSKLDKSPAIGRSPLAVRSVAGSNRPPSDRPIAGLAKKKTSVFSVAERMAALERRGGVADAR